MLCMLLFLLVDVCFVLCLLFALPIRLLASVTLVIGLARNPFNGYPVKVIETRATPLAGIDYLSA